MKGTNVRLQQRDIDIMNALGKVGLMSYSQIQKYFFPSTMAAYNRCSKLLNEKYIKAEYSPTGEKVFVLGSEGHNITGDYYRRETFANAGHKTMRADLYMSLLQNQEISSWACEKEYTIGKHKIFFDARFTHNDNLYLCEVINVQTTTKIKEKIIKCLNATFKFSLLIYCHEKDNVQVMWQRLTASNKIPNRINRPFSFYIYQHGYPVELEK
jgi:hypothetical protein